MRYELVYTKRAVKDVKGLDAKAKERIGKTLLRFSDEPLKYAERLIDSSLGTYRFRIGDYRVIFDIVEDEIIVLRIGHRKEIYRKI